MSPEQSTKLQQRVAIRLRPFREEDYPRMVEIGVASFPDDPWTVEEQRHEDASWDHTRYEFLRLIAEDAGGRIVGYGRISHMRWEFHPQLYYLGVVVDPPLRGRGIGGAIYDALLAELRRRNALVVRTDVPKETMTEPVAFLTRRGFAEVMRGYESRLDLATFDFARFAGAEDRVAQQGIMLPTLAAERARDPDALLKAHELQQACGRDVPAVGVPTETSFEMFLAHEVDAPTALLDAFFLALDGDRYVGLSVMQRRLAQPEVISQHLTGVLRGYRGRGIAMALKLQTVKYAQAHGYQEIRTGNAAVNRSMLRINEAMGFVKEPAWIVFEKQLG